MKFHLRNEEPKDIEQVRAILLATFPTEAESKLVEALRARGKAIISLVAVNGDAVLGHILFSPVTTSPQSVANGIGLAPVAVRPDVQGKGIGSQLIRDGLLRCKELGYDYCVVLGDPKYYQRFGFKKASSFGLENECGVENEFMVTHFSDRAVFGLVKYVSEFGLYSV
jgi:putative acetyltransferase